MGWWGVVGDTKQWPAPIATCIPTTNILHPPPAFTIHHHLNRRLPDTQYPTIGPRGHSLCLSTTYATPTGLRTTGFVRTPRKSNTSTHQHSEQPTCCISQHHTPTVWMVPSCCGPKVWAANKRGRNNQAQYDESNTRSCVSRPERGLGRGLCNGLEIDSRLGTQVNPSSTLAATTWTMKGPCSPMVRSARAQWTTTRPCSLYIAI